MGDLIDLPGLHRHGQSGYFSLAELPQRASIAADCWGTGWWELDQIFKFYHGQFVVVTGIAGHGKSTLILNMLCNIAREQGRRTFAYVPENEGHLRAKLQKIWADDKTFNQFCAEQFYVQSAVPEFDERPRTMGWVLERAVVAVNRDKCDVVLIDPWNELERARGRDQLMTDYIGQCLMMLKDFCRTMQVSVIVVAHPTKAVNENGGRLPGLADIEGSMNWFNKCDNGLIVHRDPEKPNTCQVISAKVREQPDAGKRGSAFFWVDPETGKFTPQVGGVLPDEH